MKLLLRRGRCFAVSTITTTSLLLVSPGVLADPSLVGIAQYESREAAKKLAPGIISTEENVELNAVFSPNGQEFYFCRLVDGIYRLFRMDKQPSGKWSKPSRVHLKKMDEFEIVDPWITPDGKQMLYISNAPTDAFQAGSVNIWAMKREGNGWGTPHVLSSPINSQLNEIYPMPVESGNLYFNSTRNSRGDDRDIFVATRKDGKFQEPVNLGPPVSSPYREGDVFVAPDESYLIVTSAKPGGFGKSDLYISYRQEDGTWGQTINLGPKVNSEEYDYTPVVSPDGKYFFFTRAADIYWIETADLGIPHAQ